MKFALVFMALASVAFAAPQPRKIFHENFMDFLDLISTEAGDAMQAINFEYFGYEEYLATLDYMRTADFNNLVFEMEDLPEFRAVVDFLESHSVDITFFINLLNESFDLTSSNEEIDLPEAVPGKDFNQYVVETIAILPKDSLAALFSQKLEEDEDFKAAIEGLQSEEFFQLWDALWESSVFQAEVQTLQDNGVSVDLLVNQVVAIFGQDFMKLLARSA